MPGVKAVKVSDVRKEFDRRYIADEVDPDKAREAKRKAFKRALNGLPGESFSGGEVNGVDWIWSI
jgi:hypothetical protein